MLFGKTAEQIEHPGPRVTAIGKLAVYPPDHPKAGEIVEDEAIRARAVDNYRKLSDSYVRLTGAALAPPGTGLNEDQVRMMAEIIVARRDRAQQAPRSRPATAT
jgi:hypothetical protein